MVDGIIIGKFLAGFVGSALLQVTIGAWFLSTFREFALALSDSIFPGGACLVYCLLAFCSFAAGMYLLPTKRALAFGILAGPFGAVLALFLYSWMWRTFVVG